MLTQASLARLQQLLEVAKTPKPLKAPKEPKLKKGEVAIVPISHADVNWDALRAKVAPQVEKLRPKLFSQEDWAGLINTATEWVETFGTRNPWRPQDLIDEVLAGGAVNFWRDQYPNIVVEHLSELGTLTDDQLDAVVHGFTKFLDKKFKRLNLPALASRYIRGSAASDADLATWGFPSFEQLWTHFKKWVATTIHSLPRGTLAEYARSRDWPETFLFSAMSKKSLLDLLFGEEKGHHERYHEPHPDTVALLQRGWSQHELELTGRVGSMQTRFVLDWPSGWAHFEEQGLHPEALIDALSAAVQLEWNASPLAGPHI